MKKIFSSSLLLLAVSLLSFTSCLKQSTFNVKDIPGNATIYGTLDVPNNYSQDAVSVKVYADIQNSELTAMPESPGVTTIETMTDEGGNYSIKVPTTPDGVKVTIRSNDIMTGDDLAKGTVYRLAPMTVKSVKPGQIERMDGSFVDVKAVYGRAAIYGKLSIPAYGQEGIIMKVYADIRNSDLTQDPTAEGYTTVETVTNMDGHYSLEVPTILDGVNVTIRANDVLIGDPMSSDSRVYRLNQMTVNGIKPGQVEQRNGSFYAVSNY